jgi:hypothetical protein
MRRPFWSTTPICRRTAATRAVEILSVEIDRSAFGTPNPSRRTSVDLPEPDSRRTLNSPGFIAPTTSCVAAIIGMEDDDRHRSS